MSSLAEAQSAAARASIESAAMSGLKLWANSEDDDDDGDKTSGGGVRKATNHSTH